jgi:peptide/nickel transport system permease protein
MGKIVLHRLIQAVMVAWGVCTLTFVLLRSLPGDMAYRIAAGRYGYDNVDGAAADAVRAELGLERPVLEQYLDWLVDLLQFDLGTTLVSGAPVTAELQHLLGHSMLLAAAALLLSALIALPLGVLCAIRSHGKLDLGSLMVSSLLRAQPVFVIGLLLILAFALQLGWLPVAGFGTALHLVLPSVALALGLAAVSNRVVRNSTYEVLHSAYFEFARVKGLTARQTFVRHGIRNMAVPVVAFMGIQLVGLIEGIVMVESLFSWPGIGHGLAHAIFSRDIPMIQGAALTLGLLFVLLNTAVDLLCHWLDPRGNPS